MNGPQHYDAAQAALVDAMQPYMAEAPAERQFLVRVAAVHALLALAAAAGLNDTVDGMPFRDRDAWQATAGVQPQGGGQS